MTLRIKLIQFLIHINEKLIFYPRLAAYYKSMVGIQNPVIIDVGANKGQSINFFLKLFPKANIIAFEPNNKLYQKLIKKYGHLSNVEIVNKGVSNQYGKLQFRETITDETSTFEELNYDSEYLKMKSRILGINPEKLVIDVYDVEVIKLNDFILDRKLNHINVLKIDTEGHELKCLEGLFSGQGVSIDLIQLENHRDDMYFNEISEDEITNILNQNQFKLNKKIKHGFGEFDELIFKTNKSNK